MTSISNLKKVSERLFAGYEKWTKWGCRCSLLSNKLDFIYRLLSRSFEKCGGTFYSGMFSFFSHEKSATTNNHWRESSDISLKKPLSVVVGKMLILFQVSRKPVCSF